QAAGRLATTVARAVTRQEAARQRAPGDDADALIETERVHLALFLTVDEVVMVLHGDEARPAVEIGGVLRLGELPREHARRADVTRLARLHHIVQGVHRLFDGRLIVPAVDLVEVHVFHAQA